MFEIRIYYADSVKTTVLDPSEIFPLEKEKAADTGCRREAVRGLRSAFPIRGGYGRRSVAETCSIEGNR